MGKKSFLLSIPTLTLHKGLAVSIWIATVRYSPESAKVLMESRLSNPPILGARKTVFLTVVKEMLCD